MARPGVFYHSGAETDKILTKGGQPADDSWGWDLYPGQYQSQCYQRVSNRARSGNHCVKFRVEETWPGWTGNTTYRAETSRGGGYYLLPGKTYYLGWSLFIEDNTNNRNMASDSVGHASMWQLHDNPTGSSHLNLHSSKFSFEIGRQGRANGIADPVFGEWMDFVLHIKVSSGSDGFAKLYYGSESDPIAEDGAHLIYNRTGPSMNSGSQSLYNKIGIYRTSINGKKVDGTTNGIANSTRDGPYTYVEFYADETRYADVADGATFESVKPGEDIVTPPGDIPYVSNSWFDYGSVSPEAGGSVAVPDAVAGRHLLAIITSRLATDADISVANGWTLSHTYTGSNTGCEVWEKVASGTDDLDFTYNVGTYRWSALVVEVENAIAPANAFIGTGASALTMQQSIDTLSPVTQPGMSLAWLILRDQQRWTGGGGSNIITEPVGFSDFVWSFLPQANSPLTGIGSRQFENLNDITGSWSTTLEDDFAGAGQIVFYQTPGANLAPVIDTQPESVIVNDGEPAVFTLTASDPEGDPISYQWYENSVIMAGENAATLAVTAAVANTGDYYHCVVSDDQGNDTTSNTVYMYVAQTYPAPIVRMKMPDGSWHDMALVSQGGTTGQVLTKTSGEDYEYAWSDPAASGGGNVEGNGALTTFTVATANNDWITVEEVEVLLSAQKVLIRVAATRTDDVGYYISAHTALLWVDDGLNVEMDTLSSLGENLDVRFDDADGVLRLQVRGRNKEDWEWTVNTYAVPF